MNVMDIMVYIMIALFAVGAGALLIGANKKVDKK